jgi:Flp pilus assembly pilin Flp
MTNLYCKVRSLMVSNKKGQGLVEYGLLLAGVAIVGLAVFTSLSTNFKEAISGLFDTINETLTGAAIGD